MLQTNVREEYRITTLEVVKLIEDLISYIKKKDLLEKIQLEKTKVRQYSAKVKTENSSNTLTLTLSTALITDKFSVALLTKLAILNNANIALVDAKSQQKLEKNYFEVRAQHLKYDVIDALTITLIKDDDDLLGTVNSHIKLRRLRAVMLLCQTTKLLGNSNKVTFQPNELLEQPSPPEQLLLSKKRGQHSKLIPDRPPLKRCKTKAADSRHAKASRGRTKKDKDSENSDTSSDVPRLCRRDRAAARAQSAKRKHPLDSDDYCSDSSLDINSKDNLEDEEATTAKDLAREQKERLKALLNAKTRDGLSARVRIAIEHCTLEEIFANAISIGKTRAITEVQNAQAEGNATEHNAVNDNDKLYSTKGKRTFHCANPLALQFCFFSNSPPENIGRLMKEEAIEMRINTTNAISKALAAANKLVAPRSYVLESGRTVFNKFHNCKSESTIIAKFYQNIRNSVTSDRIYKIEDTVYHEHESSHKYKELISQGAAVAQRFMLKRTLKTRDPDILEKEGLNKSEASRRVIFNCFEMQAIASYPALATLKAAQFKTYSSCKVKRFTLNSVKDLFTNLSKDYFLSIAAEDAAKAANTLLPLKEVRAKILIESYKPIVQALAEMCVSIVYFNPDSELELKVLGKQDVKTTS
ncbi:hypothetical protein HBI60_077770 [Parastagonospora nodorum]|nr:hypothetical protein HBI60_077770 [Parastagonospora nodorum]